jgi:hypothetical protein
VYKLLFSIVLVTFSYAHADTTPYGDPLSNAIPVRIGELLNDPGAYVDKSVKIVGLVDDVCPMKGCWVDILAEQSQQTIRFKVEDDVVTFPAQAKGQQIVAEGMLRRHEMNERRARDWLAHLAEEKGESFDRDSHEGPLAFYQIEGVGAEVIAGN